MLFYTQSEPQLINPVSEAFTCENESQLEVLKAAREECGWNQAEYLKNTIVLNIFFFFTLLPSINLQQRLMLSPQYSSRNKGLYLVE